MRNLNTYIKESYSNSNIHDNDTFIVEGININTENRTVSLTDNHSHGVDFSLLNNPIYDKIVDVDIISIFKRTKLYDTENRQRDSNPFIYALKNKNGWKFNISDDDIKKYLRRFIDVCSKLDKKYDTVIIVPSSSSLNERFMKSISNLLNIKDKINEYFIKLNADEVFDSLVDNIDEMRNDLGDNFNEALAKIKQGFRKMKTNYFEAKYIPKEYLKYIKYIDDNGENVSDMINNKNVLLLDDIVSSGNTVSSCLNNIKTTFKPKSITVLTLLSKVK